MKLTSLRLLGKIRNAVHSDLKKGVPILGVVGNAKHRFF